MIMNKFDYQPRFHGMQVYLTKKVALTEVPHVDQNLGLLDWLFRTTKEGYLPLLDVHELEVLLNKIVSWYEFKYPSKTLVVVSETQDELTKMMTIEELKNRLTPKEVAFLENHYRMGNGQNFIDGTLSFEVGDISGKPHYLNADVKSGQLVGDLGIFASLIKRGSITLEELSKILSICPEYDTTTLRRILFHHEYDTILLNTFLSLVTLTLRNHEDELCEEARQKRAKLWIMEASTLIGEDHTINGESMLEPRILSTKDLKGQKPKKLVLGIMENTYANYHPKK